MENMQSKTGENNYLACEKYWVFLLLIFVGGYFGAFTYCLRGGVFCNATTSNLLLVGVELGRGSLSKAWYYVVPVLGYLLGTVISEGLPKAVKKRLPVRWDTLFIAFEIIVVIILALLPENAPFRIAQVTINALAAMQYSTFRQAEGEAMATTFCTNHVRQTGTALVKWMRKPHPEKQRKIFFRHVWMLCSFALGSGLSCLLGKVFLGKSLLFAAIPLAIILGYLLYSDLKGEKERHNITPKGH